MPRSGFQPRYGVAFGKALLPEGVKGARGFNGDFGRDGLNRRASWRDDPDRPAFRRRQTGLPPPIPP